MEDYKNSLNFCPFCGEWEIDIIQVEEGYRSICKVCSCCGPICDSPEEAAAKWNNRTEVSFGYYDQVEEFENCTVQVLTNTKTGDVSYGWKRTYEEDSVPDTDFVKNDEIKRLLEKIDINFSRRKSADETIDFLKDILKKQIPTLPTYKGRYTCPNCAAQLPFGSYCPICGQKIDWSEANELLC